MNTHPIPRQDDRKPNPDEPWRYVCPDCRRQVQGTSTSQKYECKHCNVMHAFESLYDRKNDCIVQEDTDDAVPRPGSI